eukprot:CAMPEP_0175974872 /NCGR_PEP_ID=MMETSP0108-20121206/43619_1 /TAXON_ID=195067 ORGANISM="Goniomonas pacifica, Strain CCMP1869" /NCGR_SAMPLE_ID=MMETSP0108 /ASSEMBLY_ACC=CAM_ASM_000204 /LENGTH=59 /DNA_ID=CAMNT_0017304535 /DNA_START=587 /DNA_END=766 /DNA_ORIENTATION=-
MNDFSISHKQKLDDESGDDGKKEGDTEQTQENRAKKVPHSMEDGGHSMEDGGKAKDDTE